MVDTPLRIGIIGAGIWSTVAHIPQLRQTGQAEIVAICRRDQAKLDMIQAKFQIAEAYTDWQAMLDRAALDAVVVSTPHHLHTQPTLAALQRGLHVLVEKPMALRSEDAFIDAVRGKPNWAPASECAYAVALTQAVYRSLAERRIVTEL